MQLFATPSPFTQVTQLSQPTQHRVASTVAHRGARPWPFLVSNPISAQDMVMAHAKRIIATSKAHFEAH